VDKSLLVADVSGKVVRYRLLESLKAYGLARLAEQGEVDAATAAHRHWCVALAESVEAGVRGPDQLTWLEVLDDEHDNLGAALASSILKDHRIGMRILSALILPWWFRGRGREARQWLDRYLDVAPDLNWADHVKTATWSGLLADFGGGPDQSGRFETDTELAERRQTDAVATGVATRSTRSRSRTSSTRPFSLSRAMVTTSASGSPG
jgi:hypothetical protein